MLVEEGADVRATYHRPQRLARLGALGEVTPVRGDICDPLELRRAFKGCEIVYHVAGFVGSRPRGHAFSINALSARVVVEAAAAAKVRRVVHTSSLAGIGPSSEARTDEPSKERDLFNSGHLGLTYANSKHEGEYEALAASARLGVEVVIVNPAYVFGVPVDRMPEGETSTKVIGNYLRGRLPGVLDGGLNAVDVLDVARGHLLAGAKGAPGNRYILGAHNLTWVQLLERVALLSGVRRPLLVLPDQVVQTFALMESVGIPPPMRAEAVKLMSLRWQGSSEKARKELGYRTRPLDETLERTIDWHRELIESGTFDAEGGSSRTLIAASLRFGQQLGLHKLLEPVEKAGGFRLLACT
jgi:dihydroflavonol-4-reductase